MCNCKSYSHFFNKNTCELDIVLSGTVYILTTDELVKLTMFWTTGTRIVQYAVILLADNEGPDWTMWTCRLIWDFAVFSWSNADEQANLGLHYPHTFVAVITFSYEMTHLSGHQTFNHSVMSTCSFFKWRSVWQDEKTADVTRGAERQEETVGVNHEERQKQETIH